MHLSVIIPAYNEAVRLSETMYTTQHALLQTTLADTSWEIVVCDNNSTDATAITAQQLGARVVPEAHQQIGQARNTGASAASGQWLLYIDADTHPSPELMQEVIELTREAQHIGCGSTVRVIDGTRLNKLRMERLNPLFRAFKLCGGAFLLCEAKAFRVLGGFSEGLYAYEEIDFVLRLKRYGRTQGKAFAILHRHPVLTSGRKGDCRLGNIARMFGSNVAALVLFVLHWVLPAHWLKGKGRGLFGYWYKRKG